MKKILLWGFAVFGLVGFMVTKPEPAAEFLRMCGGWLVVAGGWLGDWFTGGWELLDRLITGR